MTHSSSPTAPTMVIQYGHRDDDDEDFDSDDERCNKGFLGGMKHLTGMTSTACSGGNNNRGGGLSAFLGSSMNLYRSDDDDDDDYDKDDNSDDEGSVCSKTSVASKASQAFKKFGESLRFNRKDKDEDESSSEEEDDSDDDDYDDSDDEASVASRASQTIMRVTGKISQALRVGRRKSNEYESDEDEEESESSDEEEDDPLSTQPRDGQHTRKSRGGSLLGHFTSNRPGSCREMQHQDGEHNSATQSLFRRRSNEKERAASQSLFRRRSNEKEPAKRALSFDNSGPTFRRTQTSEHKQQPLSRRHTTDHARQTTSVRKQLSRCHTSDEAIPRHSNRSKQRMAPKAYAAAQVVQVENLKQDEAKWSMNVTEQMLEQYNNSHHNSHSPIRA